MIFPIGWGLCYDGLLTHGYDKAHAYGGIYALSSILCVLVVIAARQLPDPGAHRMRDFVMILARDLRHLVRRAS